MLAEQSLGSYSLRVKDVHQRYRILRKTRCEYYHFKVLAHLNNELLAVWSDLDVNVARTAFDIDWKHDICLVSRLERGVNQCLINVEQQCLAAAQRLSLTTEQVLPVFIGQFG